MKVKYSVTFEFDTRAPLTHRGTVTGSKAATCVRLATKEAQALLRPQGWSSMVCVLLERLPDEAEDRSTKRGDPVPVGDTTGA